MNRTSSSRPTDTLRTTDTLRGRGATFGAFLVFIAMAIAVGGMACVETVNEIDDSVEGDTAT